MYVRVYAHTHTHTHTHTHIYMHTHSPLLLYKFHVPNEYLVVHKSPVLLGLEEVDTVQVGDVHTPGGGGVEGGGEGAGRGGGGNIRVHNVQ